MSNPLLDALIRAQAVPQKPTKCKSRAPARKQMSTITEQNARYAAQKQALIEIIKTSIKTGETQSTPTGTDDSAVAGALWDYAAYVPDIAHTDDPALLIVSGEIDGKEFSLTCDYETDQRLTTRETFQLMYELDMKKNASVKRRGKKLATSESLRTTGEFEG